MAARLGLLVTGGSDYHRDGGHHEGTLGRVTLPQAAFDRPVARRRGAESGIKQ